VADVARSIVAHSSDELRPDLILLSSHGNSVYTIWFSGTSPQEVAAASGIPVLLIKPNPNQAAFHLDAHPRAAG